MAATTPQENSTPPAAVLPSSAARISTAQSLVHRNVLWAAGVGLVPLPIVDFLGVSAVHLKMLRELSELYNVQFSEQLAKKLLASLVAGLGSAGLGTFIAVSFFKFVPLIGPSLGAISLPVLSGAITLAIGRVFVAHFESGGTILDFNPNAIREHFRAEFEQAKLAVSQMKKEEPGKSAASAAAAKS